MQIGQLSFFGETRETRESILESRINISQDLKLNWERIAKIALPRFPELQPRERISRREIERRLSELKRAGFPIKDYREMPQREMFCYFVREIRPYVYRMAGKYCPEVVERIDKRNKEIKEEVHLFK